MVQAAVARGRLGDGVDLGRAARDAVELANAAHEAAKSTPAVVRAVVASRFAPTQAAVGNARDFHAAAEETRSLLDTPGALDNLPPYLSWFGPALDSQLAQAGLTLAEASSRDGRGLLDSAEAVLGSHAADPASTLRRSDSVTELPIEAASPNHRLDGIVLCAGGGSDRRRLRGARTAGPTQLWGGGS